MYEVPGFCYSLVSEGDIARFAPVVVNSNGAVEVAGAGVQVHGFAQMPAAAASPEVIRVMKTGITVAVAGGQVTTGEEVESDGSGGVVSGVQNGGVMCGVALTAAGGAGEQISVLLY